MGIADLHIHSTYSWDGTCDVSAILKKASHHLNLDVIAITDHDEIEGALEAQRLAPFYRIEVIPGIEISTQDGHLLGYFLHEKVPAGLPLIETLLCIGDQDGIAIAAHPEAQGMTSLSFAKLEEAIHHPEASKILLGVEAYNASLVYMKSNAIAEQISRQLPLAAVGNSDAHLLWMIGRGATRFPGKTATDLRKALIQRKTTTIKSKTKNNATMIGHWLLRKAMRSVGWISWNPAPGLPLRFGKAIR